MATQKIVIPVVTQNGAGLVPAGGLPTAFGGTGQTTPSAAFDALATAAAALGLSGVSALLFGLQLPNVKNSNYTFALSDVAGLLIHNDVNAGYTYTIPPHSTVAWPTNYCPHIKILNNSSAILTLAPGGGVTLKRADGVSGAGSRVIAPNSSALIYEIAQDSWIVEGNGLS